MKISDTNGKPLSGLDRAAALPPAAEGVRAPAVSRPSAKPDRVQLSNLSEYLAAARSDSPAHVAKLGELKATVAGGGYHVDPLVVSHAIIQDSLRFGARMF